MSFVTSYFPGRIRLRAAILKDRDISEKLIEAVKELGFDGKFTYNALSGSILIEYNPSIINDDVINSLKPLKDRVMALRPAVLFYSAKQKDFLLSQIYDLKDRAKEFLK